MSRFTNLERVLLVASAACVLWVYGSLFHQLAPSRFIPSYADEIYYHKQAESFAVAGWSHGYWGGEMEQSPVGGCDVHGCGYMVATGLTGRLFGWGLSSLTWFNLACTALALGLAWWLMPRPRARPLLLSAAVLLTNGVTILYIESGMQEPLHVGGMLVLAVIAWRLLQEPDRRRWIAAYLATASLLGLIRFNWVVALPLIGLLLPGRSWRTRGLWTGAATLLAGVIYFIASLTRPAASFHSPLTQPAHSLVGAIVANVVQNSRSLVDGSDHNLVAMRILWLATLIGVVVALKRSQPGPARAIVAWAGAQLAAMTILSVAFYLCLNYGDFRIISIQIVGALVALVLAQERVVLPALLALQLACAPVTLALTRSWNEGRLRDAAEVARHTAELDRLLARGTHPGQGRWCHTVAVEMWGWPGPLLKLLSMPRGYGIELVRDRRNLLGHPARFVFVEHVVPPGYVPLGFWQGLSVYENPSCGLDRPIPSG
jgi:hypothetical protein